VPRLAHQAAKIGNLGVRAEPLRDHDQANGPPGKIRDQFLHDRDNGIFSIVHGKQNFKFRIVLAAKARKIFVGAGIEATDWLQYTDGRSLIFCGRRLTCSAMRHAKESPRGVNSNEVVKQRAERQSQNRPPDDCERGRVMQGRGQIVRPRHAHAEADQSNSRPARPIQLLAQK
jgi:hypothetical protein